MEVETRVARGGGKNSLEPESRIQQVRRVRSNSRQRSIEIHRDTGDLGKGVRNEIAYVLRSRNAEVTSWDRKISK